MDRVRLSRPARPVCFAGRFIAPALVRISLKNGATMRFIPITQRNPDSRVRSTATAGFTLVEILIVVIILGILAAIVLPQFSNASQLARENTLKDELRYLRNQTTVYAAQHLDVAPGYPGGAPMATPTTTDFFNQMTNVTDDRGNVGTSFSGLFEYGPYLTAMPTNPVNSFATISVLPNGSTIPSPADGTTGFYYIPATQTWEPNVVGTDANGVAYSTY